MALTMLPAAADATAADATAADAQAHTHQTQHAIASAATLRELLASDPPPMLPAQVAVGSGATGSRGAAPPGRIEIIDYAYRRREAAAADSREVSSPMLRVSSTSSSSSEGEGEAEAEGESAGGGEGVGEGTDAGTAGITASISSLQSRESRPDTLTESASYTDDHDAAHTDAANDSYLALGQSYVSNASSFLHDAVQMLAPNDYLRAANAFEPLDEEAEAEVASLMSMSQSGSRTRTRTRTRTCSQAHSGILPGNRHFHSDDDRVGAAAAAAAAAASGLSLRQALEADDHASLSEHSSLISRHPMTYSQSASHGHDALNRYYAAPSLRGDASLFSLARTHASVMGEPLAAGETSITLREAMLSVSPTPSSNLGLILIALSQICYSCMNLFVTLLDAREGAEAPGRGYSDGLTPPLGALEVVFVETLIIWVACLAVMKIARTEHILLGPPGAVRYALAVRGIAGWLSTLFLYISLQMLALSDATTICFLSPLATGILATIFLAEPFTVRERIAGASSLLGVAMIARPAFIFGPRSAGQPGAPPAAPGDTPPQPDDPFPHSPQADDGSKQLIGVLAALASVATVAVAWVAQRLIGRRASTYHSITYFSGASWALSLACMLILRQPFVVPSTPLSAFFLVGVGIFSLCAQVFQTLGLQREKAGRAAVMSYLQIFFATTFQVLLLGTPLEPLSVAGACLILANGAWVAAAGGKEDGGVAMH
ncbi:Permease of the drug/metabolite transporter (DMT) superfamily [Ceraceosorus bombacis]|uniref:Permease of the drug/metabolite transporter (DMT) superfamily n=1 Tax=Ceraceosorus bombacis TaxID=401625 RepID=A0A0P1B905_9BASI|nr:Permease of the drug/metabolite transporter (DMT) superfamily [Ceraceosorus bombacis]